MFLSCRTSQRLYFFSFGLGISKKRAKHVTLLKLIWQGIEFSWQLFSLTCVCVFGDFSCFRLFATPWTVARQAPVSMGILQARILEWVAISHPRESSQPRDWTCVSHISCFAGRFFTIEPPGMPLFTHLTNVYLVFNTHTHTRGSLLVTGCAILRRVYSVPHLLRSMFQGIFWEMWPWPTVLVLE